MTDTNPQPLDVAALIQTRDAWTPKRTCRTTPPSMPKVLCNVDKQVPDFERLAEE